MSSNFPSIFSMHRVTLCLTPPVRVSQNFLRDSSVQPLGIFSQRAATRIEEGASEAVRSKLSNESTRDLGWDMLSSYARFGGIVSLPSEGGVGFLILI